jgi:DNA topoisomerase-2
MVNLSNDKYKKLSEKQAALHRPQRFIGSTTISERETFLYDLEKDKMNYDKIEISPGFERVFLEILTNAADNIERSRKMKIKAGGIYVTIKDNIVCIKNGGLGIPTCINEEFGCPTPQYLFSKFSCGSNFDNNDENTGCGTFGIGATATNVFSKKFCVEIGDDERKIKYTQMFRNNLTKIEEPKEEEYNGKTYVKISYILDFERFGFDKDYKYDEKMMSFFAMHCANIAFSCRTKVVFNKKVFKFEKLEKYANLYREEEKIRIYEDKFNRLILIDKPSGVMSMVNNMTVVRGTHIDKWVNKIKKYLENSNKQLKELGLTKQDILSNIMILYSLKLSKVEYDNASKTELKTKIGDIKIEHRGTDMFNGIEKWNIVKNILERNKTAYVFRSKLSGKNSNYVNCKKLIDADMAGKKNCKDIRTLMIAEGNSAQSSVAKGRTEKTKNYIGALALKGKPINSTKHDVKKIEANKEFQDIVKAMGFRLGKEKVDYTTEEGRKTLRYDTMTLFADPDPDGEHIKAICINMLYTIWPTFLEAGLLYHIIVPEYYAKKGKKLKRFYSKQEYLDWYGEGKTGWNIEHIKGLATMEDDQIGYEIENPKTIQLRLDEDAAMWLGRAFDTTKADERKKWIHDFVEGKRYEYPQDTISYFMTHKYILFAIDDWKRSLPRIDGLKVSQRKILYISQLKKKKLRVSQLAGSVSENTQYHHGEASLQSAIINMGKDHVGANNVPLLQRSGQFGTRTGEDEGAPRYIHCDIHDITKYIYRQEDNIILEYNIEDGYKIEPDQFYPIISMAHINGSKGIGTGYSVDMGCFKPLDIINHHRRWIESCINNKEMEEKELKPWYRNYRGQIMHGSSNNKSTWISRGNFETVKPNTVLVDELPATITIKGYIKILEKLLEKGIIKGYKNKTITKKDKSDTLPRIEITLNSNPSFQKLKLEAYIPTSNIHILTSKDKCQKFTINSLLNYFCSIRLEKYHERKQKQLDILKQEIQDLNLTRNFINDVINKHIIIENRDKQELLNEILPKGYLEKHIKMPIYSLTKNNIEKLDSSISTKQQEYEKYSNLLPHQIWLQELQELESQLLKYKFK